MKLEKKWKRRSCAEKFRYGEGRLEGLLLICKNGEKRWQVELAVVGNHTPMIELVLEQFFMSKACKFLTMVARGWRKPQPCVVCVFLLNETNRTWAFFCGLPRGAWLPCHIVIFIGILCSFCRDFFVPFAHVSVGLFGACLESKFFYHFINFHTYMCWTLLGGLAWLCRGCSVVVSMVVEDKWSQLSY